MKRKPLRPGETPAYVNLRGEPIDLDALRRVLLDHARADNVLARQPAARPTAPPARVALNADDIELVFDTLCVAGCARGKTWLLHFLRGLERKSSRGAYFTAAELDAALQALRKAGRIVDAGGTGFDLTPEARAARLPALLGRVAADETWKAWARAGATYGLHSPEPPEPSFRSRDEVIAFARLVLHAGLKLERFRIVAYRVMGPAADPQMLAQALCQPFIPALLDSMDGALRDWLLDAFMGTLDLASPGYQPLRNWLDQTLASKPKQVPPNLRYLIAETRLHRGDIAGSQAALAGLGGVGIPLMHAAAQAWAGDWAAASAAFAPALKEAFKTAKVKRGIAPPSLMQFHVLSLLAQHEPAAWTAAQKFCVAESGTRQPPPDHGWGLWAHAAAVRLGDAPLQPDALAWPADEYAQSDADHNANRLVLAAWLGVKPLRWTAAAAQQTVRALFEAGKPWKADLVRQACQRLDLAVPLRLPDDPPPWPAVFYSRPQETWRDALAAIEALGTTKAGAAAAESAPATLQWRITLDAEGRPREVEPWERTAGVRGPGKAKPATLSKVKKSARLDPRDAAVARCIDAWRWNPGQLAMDVTGASIALVGHPEVFFADAPLQRVDLREALPVLEVQRVAAAGQPEHFVFHLVDKLLAESEPDPGMRFTSTDPSAEADRRNSLRIVRDAPDSARLVRISAAQRRVAELVAKKWAVPVDAKAELDAALKVLAGHFQLHSDAAAGQAVASESRLRAQFSPAGDGLQLRLLVMPFGSFGPALVPGAGRARLIALHEGLSLSTERDLAAEREHLSAVLDALPQLAGSDNGDASWLLDDPEAALAAVEQLPKLPAVAALDWPRGKPVRVITPPGAMQVSVGSGANWFAVDGELRIDEGRVIGLQRLMQLAHESRRGRFVALGEGEYLALTDRLRQQLADLQAMSTLEKGHLRLPGAAAAFLAETLDDSTVSGDKPWARRLALLNEAAALNPEPPSGLQAQLRSYQADGFAWMVRLAHAGLGACLADDMGLGKTVQTLALLLHRAELGPALVIAPTSVCANWAAEAERFAPGLRVVVYGEGERAAVLQTAAAYDVVVASYALVQIDIEAFTARESDKPWATLVLDEAQALKNAATKRVKAIATLPAAFRLALTGTPVENRLADLWSIMNLLNPGLLGSSNQFGERYANAIERQRDDAARGRLRRLVSPFLLRRTKAQVLPDLPPRTEIIHRVEPGPEERSFLEAARRSALERVAQMSSDTGSGQAAFHVLAELTRLRRAACDPRLVAPELGIVGAKVQEFEQLALELVAGRHKALVFSQFTDFLKLLAERLDGCGISYQYLDGSTPAAERGKRVVAFQRGEGDLFLISLKAGGFGLNLTAADYVLIVDPWWNPAAEDQAMGRAHRIGQLRPVTVYRLVTAGSIEERIVALHHDKRSLADGILEGQDQGAPIGASELGALLRDA